MVLRLFFFLFFFQAEDGIRDLTVTGVQTCALPICFDAIMHMAALSNDPLGDVNKNITYDINLHASVRLAAAAKAAGVGRFLFSSSRSEERREGKSVDFGVRRIIKKKTTARCGWCMA